MRKVVLVVLVVLFAGFIMIGRKGERRQGPGNVFPGGEAAAVQQAANRPDAAKRPLSGDITQKSPASPAVHSDDDLVVPVQAVAMPDEEYVVPHGVSEHFKDAEELAVRVGQPDSQGHFSREMLLRTDMKYPLVRLTEMLTRDALGQEKVISERAVVADHVMIRVRDGISEHDLAVALSGSGWAIRRAMRAPNHYLLETGDTVDLDTVESGLAWCRGDEGQLVVAVSEYDDVVYVDETRPNDTRFGELWALENTGQDGGKPGADIDAVLAWDSVTSASNVIVGVVDTGIDYSHADLAANIWSNANEIPANGMDDDGNGFVDDVHGWDFCNDDSNPDDDHYHGTHVAGTIGAVGNNSYGVVGVCWQVRLMALKFLSSEGSGAGSDAIDAIYYSVDEGVQVLNNSWGGGGYNSLLTAAIEYAASSNVLFVAAAGNNSMNGDVIPHYPGGYTNANIVCVAATDSRDKLAYFSNYGAVSVDLAAPGVGILSTYPEYHQNGPFHAISGTSMATPQVSGLAAMLLANGNLGAVSNLVNLLMECVEPLEDLEGLMVTGGRINAFNAVSRNVALQLDRSTYFYNDWCTIFVRDAEASNACVHVVSSGGDEEWVDLVEGLPGQHTNRLWLQGNASVTVSNGVLEVNEGDTFTAYYLAEQTGMLLEKSAQVSVQLEISVPEKMVLLDAEQTEYVLRGVNNGNVRVDMVVSNEVTGASWNFVTTNAWEITLPLPDYFSPFTVSGTNVYGMADEVRVDILRRGPPGTNYLAKGGADVWPYTSWETAGSNAALVARAASAGNVMLISNGVYEVGLSVELMTNVTCRSVSGDPAACAIVQTGEWSCFDMPCPGWVLDGVTVSGGDAYMGGGVMAHAAGQITNCVLTENHASYGGGVASTANVEIVNCVIRSNTAYIGAGGYLKAATVVRNCEWVGNEASRSAGGAFLYDQSRMFDCRVQGNSAYDYGGAGLVMYHNAVVSNCVIEANEGGLCGGGVVMMYYCWLMDSVVRSNRVTDHLEGAGFGGGIYILGGTVKGCLIEGNDTIYSGGGVSSYGYPWWKWDHRDGGEVRQCVIRGNSATIGGGFSMRERGFFRDCLVVSNRATDHGLGYTMAGGGIAAYDGEARNCTVADNEADGVGGGIYGYKFWGSVPMFENLVVADNRAPYKPDLMIEGKDGTLGALVRYSCVPEPIPGTNNLVGYPGFVRSGAYPYSLTPGSICINAGEFYSGMDGSQDLAGNARVQNVLVDMGAYEFSASDLVCGVIITNRMGFLPYESIVRGYVAGDDTADVYYSWDLDGDGSVDVAGYGLDMVTGRYDVAGMYDVRLTVSNASGEVATFLVEAAVHTGPEQVFVAQDGASVWPYTNWLDAATNIQDALNVGVDGSTVFVSNGTYAAGHVLSLSNGVCLTAVNGREVTVIDGQSLSRCVQMTHPDARLEHFTVRNGLVTNGLAGAGVMMRDGGEVFDCLICDNETQDDGAGGGVYIYFDGLLDSCVVRDNTADGEGGGVVVRYGGASGGMVRNCLVTGNECSPLDRNAGGGGIYTEQGGTIDSCTVVDNVSNRDAGGVQLGQNSAMRNTISFYNWYPSGEPNDGLKIWSDSDVEHCCLATATEVLEQFYGVITNAPLFADRVQGDFRLAADSPCVNVGTQQAWMVGAQDLAGNPRVAYGAPDIGAYELPSALSCAVRSSPDEGVVPVTGMFAAVVGGANLDGLYYRWDIGNDGSVEYEGTNEASITHWFEEAGLFSIGLTITNAAGEVASCVATNRIRTEAFSHMVFDQWAGTLWTAGVPYRVSVTAVDTNGVALQCFDSDCTVSMDGYPAIATEPSVITFTDGVWTGTLSVLGAVSNGAFVVDDGAGRSGTGSVFSVTTGPLDHLGFGPIASPQSAGVAFPLRVEARDERDYVRVDYTNTASLRVWELSTNQQYFTIGEGSETLQKFPINTGTTRRRMQCIYPAGSIGKAMRIRSLAFRVTYLPGAGLNQWTIRMKHTTNTYYETGAGWEAEGWTTVYYGSAAFPEGGWRTFEFDEAFDYDGTNNLMVDFSFCNSFSTFFYNGHVQGTEYPDYCALQGSGGTVHPAGWPTNGYDPAGGLSDVLPDLVLREELPAVSCSPTVTAAFVDGVWTGMFTVSRAGTNMYVEAVDTDGVCGESGLFNVGTVALTISSEYGTCDPAVGTHYYAPGSVVTCLLSDVLSESNGAQYVGGGWQGSGSVADDLAGGTNTGPITLVQDSELSWAWRTNYWLEITITGGVASIPSGWYSAGSTQVITVVPDEGRELWYWTGDVVGCEAVGEELHVPMDYARTLQAVMRRTFYVNDASTNLDMWCTAVGDDTNSGLSASTPKASVQALLAEYNLNPGDTVRIDTGHYLLTNTIVMDETSAGNSKGRVTVEASPYGVVWDRQGGAGYVWDFDHSYYVNFRTALPTNDPIAPVQWAKIINGEDGTRIHFLYNLLMERIEITGCSGEGLYVVCGDNVTLSNLLIHGNGGSGIDVGISADGLNIRNCTIASNETYQLNTEGDAGFAIYNSIFQAVGGDSAIIRREQTTVIADMDYNCYDLRDGALMGSYGGVDCEDVPDWRVATGLDSHSLAIDPLFANEAASDYHLSSRVGWYADGVWSNSEASSPCLDAGAADADASGEPSPNGDRINMGAYGGTICASLSDSNRTLNLIQPRGGEFFKDLRDSVTVSWKKSGTAWEEGDTVAIMYSLDHGSNWTTCAMMVNADQQSYSWRVTDLPRSMFYRMRILCEQDVNVWDESDDDFRLGTNMVFYVNDSSTARDCWATAAGDDANSGLTADAPKATVTSVLSDYTLEPGDTVRIDSGSYALSRAVAVDNRDSGDMWNDVCFEFSPFGVRFARNSGATASYNWYLDGCEYLTLRTVEADAHPEWAARYAVMDAAGTAVYMAGAKHCHLERLELSGNGYDGINLRDADGTHLRNVLIAQNGRYGVYASLDADQTSFENCTVADNGTYQVYGSYSSSSFTFNNSIIGSTKDHATLISLYAGGYYVAASDGNLFYAGDAPVVMRAENSYSNLADWCAASGHDAHSWFADPLFADRSAGDYHLQSFYGRYATNGTWVTDARQSPAIDGGIAGNTYDREPIPNGLRLNVGAYGNTEFASRSFTNRAHHVVTESAFDVGYPAVGRTAMEEGSQSMYVTTGALYHGTLSTQFVCEGWTVDGADASGNATGVVVILTNDIALSWSWTTNYWLHVLTDDHGTTTPTSSWQSVGSTVSVSAVAGLYYHFDNWTGAVESSNQTVDTVMLTPLSLTGHFAANLTTNTGTPEWWLATHGMTGDFESYTLLDHDNDGYLTWQEYVTDTDPTNPLSHLQLTGTQQDGHIYAVVEGISTDRTYAVMYKTNITDQTDWIEIYSQPGSSNQLTIELPQNTSACCRVSVDL